MHDDHDYNDNTPMIIPRPCDRCGAGNIEYAQNNHITNTLCAEVQMAFGLIAWLCHDCRKQWHTYIKNHTYNRQILHAQLELEFWKAKVNENTPDTQLQTGKQLLDKVENLELHINNIANEWLINN